MKTNQILSDQVAGAETHGRLSGLSGVSPQEVDSIVRAVLAVLDSEGKLLPTLRRDPVAWTEDGYLSFSVARKGLDPKTAARRYRMLRYYMEHPQMPVKLNPLTPESEKTLEEHIRYRREKCGDTLGFLLSLRKAIIPLLEMHSIPTWPALKRRAKTAPKEYFIPDEETVKRIIYSRHGETTYTDRLYRTILYLGFHTGLRPYEIASLRVDDVDVAAGTLRVHVTKGRQRDRILYNPKVVSAPNRPSLVHYLKHHRPSVDAKKSDALFLTSKGEPFTADGLVVKLRRVGGRIWPNFSGYVMRHTFATMSLLASTRNDRGEIGKRPPDVKRVQRLLGHTNVAITDQYYIHNGAFDKALERAQGQEKREKSKKGVNRRKSALPPADPPVQ